MPVPVCILLTCAKTPHTQRSQEVDIVLTFLSPFTPTYTHQHCCISRTAENTRSYQSVTTVQLEAPPMSTSPTHEAPTDGTSRRDVSGLRASLVVEDQQTIRRQSYVSRPRSSALPIKKSLCLVVEDQQAIQRQAGFSRFQAVLGLRNEITEDGNTSVLMGLDVSWLICDQIPRDTSTEMNCPRSKPTSRQGWRAKATLISPAWN
jgi:hypothetical protein